MPISWEADEAEIDRLRTELNTALASERLWFSRMLKAQRERDQAAGERNGLQWSLAEWEAAYGELLREHRRLQNKCDDLEFDAESARWLLGHYEQLAAMGHADLIPRPTGPL